MIFSTNTKTTVNQAILAKVIDGVFKSNPFLHRTFMKAEKWRGETMKIPVMTATNTSNGSFSGYDTFDTTQRDTRTFLSFVPKAFYQNVTINGLDLAINQTPEKIMDLEEVEMEAAKASMADALATLLYGDGTGNGGKDLTGLEAVLNYSSVATYGSLTKANYPFLFPGSSDTTRTNNVQTAPSGVLSLNLMSSVINACSQGAYRPTIGIADGATWNYIERLYQAVTPGNMNVVEHKPMGLRGDLGFDAIMYRGIPLIRDNKATAGNLYFINEENFKWHGVEDKNLVKVDMGMKYLDGVYSPDNKGQDMPSEFHGFHWYDWRYPVSQYVKTGQFILMGDWICDKPFTQGEIKTITGV
jgi:hypothetical protein